MSSNDRKQVTYLSLISGFANMDYFNGKDKSTILEITAEGIESFGLLTENEYKNIAEFYKNLDERTAEYKSNNIDVVAYGIMSAVADAYISVLKNKRRLDIWQRLSDIAEQFLSKKIIYNELDKSVSFVELSNSLIINI